MTAALRSLAALLLAALIVRPASAETSLIVRVTDTQDYGIPGAYVQARYKLTGNESTCRTNAEGTCTLHLTGTGQARIEVTAPGMEKAEREIDAEKSSDATLFQLQPATLAQEVVVSGGRMLISEERLQQTPGSVDILDAATITRARVFNFDEALRKLPGLFTRGEEGFGLRPNIGIRGLNPNRSTKVLLLEDGIPLCYAPYGDNASYYHPPVDRYEEVEVIKGSGQIVFGPSTVGGVINYVTPMPPDQRTGTLTLIGGNRDYLNGQMRYGTRVGRTGLLFDYLRKQGEGARDNTRTGLNDANAKIFLPIGSRQTLVLKANYYGEDSQLTYSGLREDEFRANPRGNPFVNDATDFNRWGMSASHSFAITPNAVLTTNGYGSVFLRDWWRQSSNSAQRPNRAADPGCGGMANLYTTCGNEGRLRRYYTHGVEPRVRINHMLGGIRNETDFGFRAHWETQDRRQENGLTPTARSGAVVELNERNNTAYSGFLQNRFVIGNLTVTPGLRLEHVRFRRANWLANNGAGAIGQTNLTQLVPGLGVAYTPAQRLTFFAGVHRGFAPPRTEDIVNNAGGIVDLDPEMSWNYEAGVRSRVSPHLQLEGAYFRMDFANQIVPASVAGGMGSVLTSAGRTLHEGFEVAGRWDRRSVFGSRHGLATRTAFTYLPTAKYSAARFSNISGFTNVSVTGNRVPYAPEYLMTSSITYMHASGMNVLLEGMFMGAQFADDLNTINPSPDGQRGRIPGNTVWNATFNYPVEAWRSVFFVTTKNALDRLYITDRARGILPGTPRMVQAGLQVRF